jgi:hypothetical protein
MARKPYQCWCFSTNANARLTNRKKKNQHSPTPTPIQTCSKGLTCGARTRVSFNFQWRRLMNIGIHKFRATILIVTLALGAQMPSLAYPGDEPELVPYNPFTDGLYCAGGDVYRGLTRLGPVVAVSTQVQYACTIRQTTDFFSCQNAFQWEPTVTQTSVEFVLPGCMPR